MISTYVLYSLKFDRTYTGMTNNLKRRFKEHNNKQNRTTKAYAPWELIYSEAFETRIEARKKEKYLKSGKGREFIRKIINNWPRSSTE